MVQCSVCDCQDVPVWVFLCGPDCQGVPMLSSVVSVIVRVFLCGPDCQRVPMLSSVVSVIVRVFLCGPV